MADQATIQGIEYEIKGSADSAVDSLNKLATTLKKIKGVTSGGLGLNSVVRNMNKLASASGNINTSNLALLAKALKSIGKVQLNPSIVKGMKDINKAVRGFDSKKTAVVADMLKQFSALKGFSSDKFKDGMKAFGDQLERISKMDLSNLERAGKAMQSFADAFRAMQNAGKDAQESQGKGNGIFSAILGGAKKVAGAGLRGLGALLSKPFEGGIKAVKGYYGQLSKVIGGFKRIVFYRLIRQVIKEIAQAFKDGINNLYQWSALVDGRFKASMDQIATSLLYFKNSLGAAVAPIINALAPAIDFLVDKIVTLINVINQLFAKLTGAAYWTRAKKTATEYAEAAGGAGAAAKEALRYLAPFDELNVLPDDKDRGHGGGGSSTDYSDMFETVDEFSEGIANFADMIREKVEAGDWQGLGQVLGNKVNELIDMIDFAGIGAKVGTGINAWFTTKYWTLETINFQHIGSNIATFLNNALDQIDFDVIGRSFSQKFTILGDLIIGAIQNINWSLVGQSIGNYLKGAFSQVTEWLQGIDWGDLGTTVYNSLKDLLTGLDFTGIAQSLFEFLGSALGAGASFLASFISGVVTDIKNYFLQYIRDENGDGNFGAGEIISGLLNGLLNAIKNIGNWLYTNIWLPLKDGFLEAFGIKTGTGSSSGESTGGLYDEGSSLGDTILSGLAHPFVKIKEWVQEHIIDPIKEKLKGFSIKDLLFGDGDDAESPTGNDGGGTFLSGWKVKVTDVEDDVPTEKKTLKDFFAKIFKTKDEVNPDEKNLEGFDAYVYDFKDYIDQRELENMMADVVTVKDEVPKAERKLNTFEAIISTAKDEITDLKQKVINGVKGVFGSTDDTKLTIGQKIVNGVKALFGSTDQSTLPADQKKLDGFGARLKYTIKGALPAAERKLDDFWARIKHTIKGGIPDGERKLDDFWARIKHTIKGGLPEDEKKLDGFGARLAYTIKGGLPTEDKKLDGFGARLAYTIKGNLTNEQKTIDTTSNYTKTKDSLTETQKTFGSTANFNTWKDNLSNVWSYAKAWFNQYNGSDIQDWNNPWMWTYGIAYLNSANTDYLDTPWVSSIASLDEPYNNIGYKPNIPCNAYLDEVNGVVYTVATGGALFGGAWHEIPQYASGGKPHGSLFMAGEAGPEVVGHVGGRTEVLNKSQLAATMYSAVHAAMAGVRFNVGAMNVPTASADSYDEEAMYRAMLRALNDSDVFPDEIDLDGDVVYRKMVKKNQMNTRMTGVNVMATA